MKGLKTRESSKFERFFGIVQTTAALLDAVFFLEAGDGRDFVTETLEGEDLQGWLIPKEKEEEFFKVWDKDEVGEEWDDFFGFAIWEQDKDAVKVKFNIA